MRLLWHEFGDVSLFKYSILIFFFKLKANHYRRDLFLRFYAGRETQYFIFNGTWWHLQIRVILSKIITGDALYYDCVICSFGLWLVFRDVKRCIFDIFLLLKEQDKSSNIELKKGFKGERKIQWWFDIVARIADITCVIDLFIAPY